MLRTRLDNNNNNNNNNKTETFLFDSVTGKYNRLEGTHILDSNTKGVVKAWLKSSNIPTSNDVLNNNQKYIPSLLGRVAQIISVGPKGLPEANEGESKASRWLKGAALWLQRVAKKFNPENANELLKFGESVTAPAIVDTSKAPLAHKIMKGGRDGLSLLMPIMGAGSVLASGANTFDLWRNRNNEKPVILRSWWSTPVKEKSIGYIDYNRRLVNRKEKCWGLAASIARVVADLSFTLGFSLRIVQTAEKINGERFSPFVHKAGAQMKHFMCALHVAGLVRAILDWIVEIVTFRRAKTDPDVDLNLKLQSSDAREVYVFTSDEIKKRKTMQRELAITHTQRQMGYGLALIKNGAETAADGLGYVANPALTTTSAILKLVAASAGIVNLFFVKN